ncbi:hypothetical protein DVH24_037398 [Malus domestica]|uniref:F-box domain-containing protein n=1 Tax=Malus domestica TaxID=3750 RepID=A0A498HH17_MALDO|nr:hypothetical protein DVH24_037398 [Malus domestica]
MEGAEEDESRKLFRDECNNNLSKKWVFASKAGEKVGNRGLSRRGFKYSRQLRLEVDGSGSLGTVPCKPQDADYTIHPLIDEVEALILARVPRSEYRKFCTINKRFFALLKSGELYKIRAELGIKEPSVFVSQYDANAGGPALIYTCCPDPTADELQWQALEHGHSRPTRFIVNCSVMAA